MEQINMKSIPAHIDKWIRVCTAGLMGMTILMVTAGCGGVPESEVQEREMIAAGGASYRAYCAGCHGPTGRGDGPATEYMTLPPPDLTQITARYGEFPIETLFERIDGYEARADSLAQMMPAWGNIWRGMSMEWETPQDVRARIDEILSFLRSLQDTAL